MERPKATQNIRIGMLGSIEPLGVKPNRSARLPSWKIQTRTPNITPMLRVFRSMAFAGSSTLPVIRNSTRKVVTRIRPKTSGSRSTSSARNSLSSAG